MTEKLVTHSEKREYLETVRVLIVGCMVDYADEAARLEGLSKEHPDPIVRTSCTTNAAKLRKKEASIKKALDMWGTFLRADMSRILD